MVYIQKSGSESATQQTGKFIRVSGDAKDGIYSVSITIPRGQASGEWDLFSNSFYDIYKNASVCPVYPTSENKKLKVVNNK